MSLGDTDDDKPAYATMVEENSKKQFADIDKDIFEGKDTAADTQAAVSHVKTSEDYKSIQQIIEQSIEKKFPKSKRLFKVLESANKGDPC